MDDEAPYDLVEDASAEQSAGGVSSPAPKKKYTTDDIPEERRKVGRFIKSQIHDAELTVKQFLTQRNKAEHYKLIEKLIQGRKIIRHPEALLLVELFGGSPDYWLTLEHKILANPNVSVPISIFPGNIQPTGQVTMTGNNTGFNEVAQLNPDQLLRARLASEGHTVLGEGEGMVIIPKDASPEVARMTIDAWLADRNAQRAVNSPAPR